MGPEYLARHLSAIHQHSWMVRHYARGARQSSASPIYKLRQAEIRALGLAVREAFNTSDDFEPLLAAIVDGLRPRQEEQPF